MTNKKTTPESETMYTAEFKLVQTGKNGEFRCSLKLDPEPNPDDQIKDLAYVHVKMMELVDSFFYQHGVIDQDGNMLVNTVPHEDGGVRIVDSNEPKGRVN